MGEKIIMMSIKGMLIRCFVLLTSTVLALTAQGIEISASIHNDQLTAKVNDISYPATLLDKELNSGLSNNISLLLSLYQQDNKRFAVRLNYQITYDLWDEIYTVRITDSNALSKSKRINSKADLIAFIEEIELPTGFDMSHIQADVSFQLRAQVLVNPVKTERIKKIKAWIASSQGYTPDFEQGLVNRPPVPINSAARVNSGFGQKNQTMPVDNRRLARPRFQKLFDQILEQYMTPNEVPALWRSDVAIININRSNLLNEK
tara:strand:+ start:3383 stop:4165 length:783 start_codon:yes stop_codon:yes gene_type:complete